MYSFTAITFVLLALFYVVTSTQEYRSSDLISEGSHFNHPDLHTAESGHHGGHGRVQIKVYRGPSEGHDHKHFAPHGYWVKQPADHHH